MSKKKSVFANLFRGSSGCCCSMKIVPEPPKTESCCRQENKEAAPKPKEK